MIKSTSNQSITKGATIKKTFTIVNQSVQILIDVQVSTFGRSTNNWNDMIFWYWKDIGTTSSLPIFNICYPIGKFIFMKTNNDSDSLPW